MKSPLSPAAICGCLVLLMCSFSALGQQPWLKENKPDKRLNFYEVRESFNNHWKSLGFDSKAAIPKGKGFKQYKRWEWFWEPRVGKEGNFPNASIVMTEWEKYRAAHPALASPESSRAGGAWTPLGPSTSTGGYAGVGRLDCIAFHPSDPNTFWVGSPSGGLWKTTNGGTSWTILTDNLPVMGVSSIAVDPTNPDIMYLATGDRDHVATYSVGVLKTTNGGASWSTTGLSYSVSQGQKVNGLLIHPANPQLLIAATSSGLYRTTNGGTSWTLEMDGSFLEIAFKPGTPATVYAASSGNAQIFRSTDTGDNWNQVSAFSGISRIALAVTPANPELVGALCSNNYDSGFGGYYTSTNSGASFNLTYAAGSVNLLGWQKNGGDTGGQGWYDLCLAISPTDANVVFAGGVNTWKSTNGGASWTNNTMWYNDGTGTAVVHADKHWMAYNPISPGTLYQCNDGGLYKTTNGGASWTDLSNGLQITQMYRLGNAATNANLTLAGTQDNGTKLRNAATYRDVIGGDGMEAIIDYSNANIMYGSLYFGIIQKSTDGGINWRDISSSLPDGPWVTPYCIDPVDPQTLYVGVGNNVWKTTNGGSSWSAISTGLSSNHLQTLAVAPSNNQTIYTGNYYSLFKTNDGGSSWSSLTLPTWHALTSIEVHPTNPDLLWISFSGYIEGNKVFRSDNGGQSWTNISGSLPNLPANTLEYNKNTGALYLGNDVGVFVMPKNAEDWQPFNTGLPNVVVNELEIQYSANRLRAATYGRGLWEAELTEANQLPTVSITAPDNGASFPAPANITITADATDDGSVAKVAFYQGNTKLGEDQTAPYTFDWTQVSAGDYSLTAIATDNLGLTSTSAAVAITVNDNAAPTVNITAPAPDAGYVVPTNISIKASADDADGSIVKVEFFHGTKKLGEDRSAPYAYSLKLRKTGTYSFTARATDNKGASTTSEAVQITATRKNRKKQFTAQIEGLTAADSSSAAMALRLGPTPVVYPNPVDNTLTIAIGEAKGKIQLALYNELGKLLYFKEYLITHEQASIQLELTDLVLQPGLHLLRLQTEDGQNTVFKVLKK